MEYVVNLSLGKARSVMLNGREYLVGKVTSITPGILHGSEGPLFYPEKEVAHNPAKWNMMPLTVYHPMTANGDPASASDPGILQRQGTGFIKDSVYNGKLQHEFWVDVERATKIDNTLPEAIRIVPRLRAGQPIEVSTGLYTENEDAPEGSLYKGRPYSQIARNYKPDHLAILPDQVGACSVNDGCGMLVNANTKPKQDMDGLLSQFIEWLTHNVNPIGDGSSSSSKRGGKGSGGLGTGGGSLEEINERDQATIDKQERVAQNLDRHQDGRFLADGGASGMGNVASEASKGLKTGVKPNLIGDGKGRLDTDKEDDVLDPLTHDEQEVDVDGDSTDGIPTDKTGKTPPGPGEIRNRKLALNRLWKEIHVTNGGPGSGRHAGGSGKLSIAAREASMKADTNTGAAKDGWLTKAAPESHVKAANTHYDAANAHKLAAVTHEEHKDEHMQAAKEHIAQGDRHIRASKGIRNYSSSGYGDMSNMDPHGTSKQACSASMMTEHPKVRDPALAAMDASKDEDPKAAIKAHIKAASIHEGAATMARKDGSQEDAYQHDNAAALHRKAASMHSAMINNYLVENEFESDEQRLAFFGHLEESKNSASKSAGAASKKANKSGRAEHHLAASQAHREAAKLYEKGSNIAKGHNAAAREHSSKAKGTHNMVVKNRQEALKKLTANCTCPKRKAAYNELQDSELIAIANAFPPKKKPMMEEDDEEDDSEMEPQFNEESEIGPFGGEVQAGGYDEDGEQVVAPALKGQGKVEKKGIQNYLAQHGSQQDVEIWENAVKMNKNAKVALVKRLISNVDPNNKGLVKRLVANHMKKSLQQLQDEVAALPVINRQPPRARDDEDMLGLASMFDPQFMPGNGVVTNTQLDNDPDDLLETPTINWRESRNGKVHQEQE